MYKRTVHYVLVQAFSSSRYACIYIPVMRCVLSDDERAYAFLRVETGDEMSKRQKFALIVWVGPQVSALKKAKMSTEKAFVKQVFVVGISPSLKIIG